MTEKTSESTPSQDAAAMPVRLVRGTASPDEFSALVAVVAVLATASGEGEPDPTDRTSSASGKLARSLWSSPARMVRGLHPHGPGGWRASASPR